MLKKQLHEIVDIRTGYSFRKKIEEEEDAKVVVVQPKDVKDGTLIGELTKVNSWSINSLESHLLQKGDVLLSNKGSKFTSYLCTESNSQMIASSSFFVLRPKREVLPAFLKWFLSQETAKEELFKRLSGSVILSLSKTALKTVAVPCPSLVVQQKIVDMEQKVQNERIALKALIEKRKEYLTSYAWELIHATHES